MTSETPNAAPHAAQHDDAPPQPHFVDESDDDSALGDDMPDSTTSIDTGMIQYRTLNGRTFHRYTQCWAPNDEEGIQSMFEHHQLFTLLLGGRLHLAPLDEHIGRALDLGTGSGHWAIDFADEYPEAIVTGTDLSPIQPRWVPTNCNFEIDNAEDEWTWPENTFDFIHLRQMIGSIRDWNKLYRQAYRALKPGGYIEHFEMDNSFLCDDGTISDTSPILEWRRIWEECGRRSGRTFRPVAENVQVPGLEAAGFEDLVVQEFKSPVGTWPDEEEALMIGRIALDCLLMDMEGYFMQAWFDVTEGSIDEMRVFLALFRREVRSKKVHAYCPHRLVYARKPLGSS